MNAYTPSPELRRFVDRLLDGDALSKPESARLEELLEDDDALAYYVQTVQQECLLPHAVRALPAVASPATMTQFVKPYARYAALASAACVIFSLGFATKGLLQPTQPRSVPATARPAPAKITGLVGVEWQAGGEPDLLNPSDRTKRLAFRAGLAELTYGNGVRVTLEGPADFTITGENSARLDSGKLVAAVPKGAEGFSVDYADGKVVDLGTEFAMATSARGATEVGVFDGKVELHRPNADVLALTENQALLLPQAGDAAVDAIPLDRSKFIRRIPTRDFRWEINRPGPTQVEFDVSHLVWKAANYRALFKWMLGQDGMQIRDVALCLDGTVVSRNPTAGVTGALRSVRNNMLELSISPQQFRHGRWTVRATFEPLPLAPGRNLAREPIYCLGVMQFEEGLVNQATAADFIGDWTFHYAGARFGRHIRADGTMAMSVNGVLKSGDADPFRNRRWTVENGVLKIGTANANVTEELVLRDADTLIFVKNPYENAKRVSPAQK